MQSHLRAVFIHTAIALIAFTGQSVVAADEPRSPWTTSQIVGTPNPPAPYAIRPAFPNLKFEKPTSLVELPGGRLLITEDGGRIHSFPNDISTSEVTGLLEIEGARIWHATVHPKFESKGQLFVCYSKGDTSHVSRFDVAGSPPKADRSSEVVLITWPAGGHNGGCLSFGLDGTLYISTGDGSGPNPPDSLDAAQDVSNLLGCILRIDVDKRSEGRNYSIPADNPFINREGVRPEIWSFGLRNPWKFGIDRATGNMFVADNGWESWEMVHRVVRGGNCGWPIMEGRAILRSEVQPGPTPIRPPVKDHPHSEANSVIGGPVYRGKKHPDLDGAFIYGDYITGTIWGLKSDGDRFSHRTLVDTDQRIVAFAETARGEVFVVDYDYTGQIYELIPSNVEDRSADFPRRLSETGLFTSLKEMTPADGVVPYDVVVERWTDGAEAQRWVAIPGDGTITFGEGKSAAKYPDGTVFAKHLTLSGKSDGRQPIPLETQILHFEAGVWRPYSYLWDDEGKDARLVDSIGADRELRSLGHDPFTWRVGAENECRLCHNAGSGFILGFEPMQLHRGDQLDRLAAAKLIKRNPNLADDRSGLVDPFDLSQGIDDRARSYLHGNCSSCHHPGGSAIVSFYLRRDLPFDQLRTNKSSGVGTFGLPNPKIIAPGDPHNSILLYRMTKLGYARMPYIGTRVVDSDGVTLIEEWIRSMPKAGGDQVPNRIVNLPVEHLLESSDGALAVALGIHNGEIDRQHAAAGYKSRSSDIRGLFETFIPERDRRKSLGRNFDPAVVLSLEGNADRGQLIFFSDGARCQACHHRADAGQSTGPTLAEIRKKYPRRSEMLTHIVDPSLKVDEKFATWGVITNSGRVFNGLLVSQNDVELVLKTAERKTVRVPKSEIEQMKQSRQSLMPSGVLSDLTAQEAADLITWLSSLPVENSDQ